MKCLVGKSHGRNDFVCTTSDEFFIAVFRDNWFFLLSLLIAVIDFCTVSGSHSAASGLAHSQYIGDYLLGFCVQGQITAAELNE